MTTVEGLFSALSKQALDGSFDFFLTLLRVEVACESSVQSDLGGAFLAFSRVRRGLDRRYDPHDDRREGREGGGAAGLWSARGGGHALLSDGQALVSLSPEVRLEYRQNGLFVPVGGTGS